MRFSAELADLVYSRTKAKIVRFLLNHTAAMSEREMASVLKVSHMSINRTLQELAAVNFASFVTIGKAHVWSINRQSYAYRVLAKHFAGGRTGSDPMTDLKAMIAENIPWKLVRRGILFGSLARGEDTADSDIDVCFLVANKAAKEQLATTVEKLSGLCLEKYGNRLAPYILTATEAASKNRAALWSEIQAGVEIYPPTKRKKS